jgi:hypothetical protein
MGLVGGQFQNWVRDVRISGGPMKVSLMIFDNSPTISFPESIR